MWVKSILLTSVLVISIGYSSKAEARFLSQDPLNFEPNDPQSNPGMFNRYAYTLNDPLNLIDPTGMGAVSPCGEEGGECPQTAQPDQTGDAQPEDEIIVTGVKQNDNNSTPLPDLDIAELRELGFVTQTNQYGYTGFGDCVNQSKVPIIASAFTGAGLAGVSLPVVNKPRVGIAGGGPSGNKTSVISKASRKAFGNNRAIRGMGSGSTGGTLGRVGSRTGQFGAAASFGYTLGAVGGCAYAGTAN